MDLLGGREHDGNRQHGMGRGEGGFQAFLQDHGPVIDDHEFKDQVEDRKQNIDSEGRCQVRPDHAEILFFDQIDQKTHAVDQRCQDGQIAEDAGNSVKDGVVAELIMQGRVQGGKTHL